MGEPRNDVRESDGGAVHVFSRENASLVRTLRQPRPDRNDQFGHSVAVLGNDILVGAPRGDEGAEDAGSAYRYDGASGELLQTFVSPTARGGDEFGMSIAAVGANVLVGARRDDRSARHAGAAYLFDGATGELLHTFVSPTPQRNDHFGATVAAVGDNVIIAAPEDDTVFNNAGAAYLFDSTTGELIATLLNQGPYDRFGHAVTAVGDKVLVGGKDLNARES